MYHGIINIYKEPGYTSHDVVARLRGILRQKKIGHTGTLDPDAEGVLPVCLGMGTRLCEAFAGETKTYEAVLLLGLVTDTQDTSGRVLADKSREAASLTRDAAEEAVLSFAGGYEQIPPMYSALKVGGKKLYELARQGKEVERKPRHVEIPSISIEEMELPRVRIRVDCSKGTYIRTLCHDIGEKLGCGGCMEHLTRLRVGQFRAEDSLRLDAVEALRDKGKIAEKILSVEQVLSIYPALHTLPGGDKALHNGNPCFPGQIAAEAGREDMPGTSGRKAAEPTEGVRARMYDSQGVFAGVYEYRKDRGWWRPWKMFLSREEQPEGRQG